MRIDAAMHSLPSPYVILSWRCKVFCVAAIYSTLPLQAIPHRRSKAFNSAVAKYFAPQSQCICFTAAKSSVPWLQGILRLFIHASSAGDMSYSALALQGILRCSGNVYGGSAKVYPGGAGVYTVVFRCSRHMILCVAAVIYSAPLRNCILQ